MPKVQASLSRDANRVPFTGLLPFIVCKRFTFSNAAGLGAVGTVNIFTVTGDVLVRVLGSVKTDLTADGAATLALGTANAATALSTAITATALDVGDVFHYGASPADIGAIGGAGGVASQPFMIANGADIIGTVATANITAGVIDFYCLWQPLSTDGLVTSA